MICWGNHPPSAQCSYDPGVEYVAVGTARIDYSKSSPEQSDGRAERERASQTDFATAGYYFVYGGDGLLYYRQGPYKVQNISRDGVGRVIYSGQSMAGTTYLTENPRWNPDGTQSGNSITRNGSVSASDPRTYGYNQRGELLLQNFSPSSGLNGSATYQFDGGTAGGLGLRTGVTLGTAMSGVTAQSYGTFARLGSMSVSGSLTNNSVGTPVAQSYDAAGNVTTRTAGGSTDTLTWDAFGQLVRDVRTGTGAFTWSAVYDGLGRRLQTTQGALTLQSSYDPEVEFLELVTKINGTRNWKVYGPDLDGRYGGLNGAGGLEAVYNQATSTATYVLSDTYGHGEGVLNGTTFTWNPSQSDGYGALAGSSAATPINASSVLGNLIGWRGHYIDATGLYYLGARYYAPDSGTFLSPDPLGHSASMDLYSYCDGDPVNQYDADGRVATQVKGYVSDTLYPDAAAAQSSINIQKNLLGDPLYNQWVAQGNDGVGQFYTRLNRAADSGLALDADAETRRTDALMRFAYNQNQANAEINQWKKDTILAAASFIPIVRAEEVAARTAPEMFYIENGVRRSLVSKNAGLSEIPATIYRPGSAPTTTTLRLDQLLSPKPTVPLDSRYLRIQPPIVTPIQVQPLGLPGQMPSVPLRNVILE